MVFQVEWILILSTYVIWYLLIPGSLIVSFLGFWKKPLKNIGLVLPLGIVFFSFCAFLGYLFNGTFFSIQVFILLFNLIGGLYLLFKHIKSVKIWFKDIRIDLGPDSLKDVSLLLIISLCLSTISLHSPWYYRGDAAIHLQAINNMIGADHIRFPFYSLIGSPIIPDHAYDSYYVLLSILQTGSQLPLDVVWHYLSSIFILFVPFCFYFFCRNLTSNRVLIRLFLVSLFICTTLFPSLLMATLTDAMVYPNRFYFFILLPITLGLSLSFLKSGSIKTLFLTCLCLNTFFFIHQSGYLFSLLILGGAFILNFLGEKGNGLTKRYLILLLSLLISSLPLLFLKLSSNLNFIEKASDNLWLAHYNFYSLTENFYSFSIIKNGKWGMLIALFISLILFIRQRKSSPDVLLLNSFLTSSIVFPLLIIFNPFVVPFLGKLISYPAIGRMMRIPLYYFIFAYGIYHLFKWPYLSSLLKLINPKVRFLTLILILFGTTAFLLKGKTISHERPPIAEISTYINPNSVVYSDKLTSTDIAVFNRVKVPLMRFNGALDLVPIDEQNEEALHFFSNEVNEAYIRSILKKYDSDFVILKKSSGSEKIMDSILKIQFENKHYKLYQVKEK